MLTIDRKFLFVTGKGGVGKTTASVALAKALAAAGRRVLLAVTERAQVGALLGGVRVDNELSEASPGLFVLLVEPEQALQEYGEMMLHSRAAYRALFGNRYSKSFLAAVPGLHQWASLGKAWFHAGGDPKLGGGSFDTVVFDAPATGHGLEMLRVPGVITEASAPGILKRDASAAWDMLRDPKRAGVVVVTLPEELPVQETLELIDEVHKLGVPLAGTIMNAVPAPLFSQGELTRLSDLLPVVGEQERGFVELAIEHANAQAQAERLGKRLSDAVQRPVVSLPWVEQPTDAAQMQSLTDAVVRATTKAAAGTPA